MLDRLQHVFNNGLEFSFRWPKATLAAGLFSVVVAILVATSVEQELFPTSERNQFNLEVWLPSGASLEQTEKAVARIEKEVKSDKRVLSTASFIGTSSPRFHSTYAPETPRRNFAQIFITTAGKDETQELADEYLKKFDGFLTDGYIRIRQLSMKESPAPLEVRVIGENMNDQKRIATEVAAIMDKAEGTNWTRTSYQEDYYGVKVTVKEDIAERLGVSSFAVAQTLGAGLKGYPVSTLYEGDKPIDILLRLDAKNRSNFTDIENITISTLYGTKVPLKEVADIAPAWHTGIIAHRNGLRTLTVMTEAQKGIKAAKILAAVQPEN